MLYTFLHRYEASQIVLKIYNIIKMHCFNSVLDLTLSRSLEVYNIKIKKISLPLKIGKFHLMVRNGRVRFRG